MDTPKDKTLSNGFRLGAFINTEREKPAPKTAEPKENTQTQFEKDACAITGYDKIMAIVESIPNQETKSLVKDWMEKVFNQLVRELERENLLAEGQLSKEDQEMLEAMPGVEAALAAFAKTYKNAKAIGQLPDVLDDIIFKNCSASSYPTGPDIQP